MTLDQFLKEYNCLSEMQNQTGKLVNGVLLVGLPFKKAFEVSLRLKNMKPTAESYQETINNIGKDMGLQPVNGATYYIFKEDTPIETRNEYTLKVDELRKQEVVFDADTVSFDDKDLEGYELNLSGVGQQTFFDYLYKPKR